MTARMRSPAHTARQRGQALLALIALVVIAFSWMVVTRLGASSADLVVAKRARNAVVLQQAKQAIVGWIALQATKAGEDDPGRLPCPESRTAVTTGPGGTLEGSTASTCSAPAIGRYPWRTLGTDKLVDADGEPLWYVVSPGWAKASSAVPAGYLSINSNSAGSLTVDGQANAAVALIIAPGPAINAQAATGCTARNQLQSRAAPASGIDPSDYLECFDSSSYTYSTTGASTSFNDQVLAITVADVMPALEAAVASRVSREIAPLLKTTYTAVSTWGITSSTPIFPFAAPFADPSTSTFQGVAGTREGLLPMARMSACTTGYACPPVDSTLTNWGSAAAAKSGGTIAVNSTSCSLLPSGAPTTVSCTVSTPNLSPLGTLSMSIEASINPFRALRVVSDATAAGAPASASSGATGFSSAPSCAWSTPAASGVKLSCSGSVSVSLLCGVFWFLCPTQTYTITMPVPAATSLLSDHQITDPSNSTTGWFVRNGWHQLTYYATTTNHLAGGTRSCTGASCISVTNLSTDDRAILIVAGRLLSGQASSCGSSRPSGVLSCYLEDAINRDGDLTYVAATPGPSVNDRFVIVDKN